MARTGYLAASDAPLSSAFDVLMLDLDGTTYLGRVPAPYAPEALAQAKAEGARAVYLTNNSGRPSAVVAEHLTEIGIPTAAEEVINSSQVAAHELRKILPLSAKVLLVGDTGVREAFTQAGFSVVTSADDEPDAVIQGLGEKLTWSDLSEAVLAIHRGAAHYATNLDATIPKERGPMIGNGSFVACVSHATGSHPVSFGKPEPHIFAMASEKYEARRPLAVGDRLDTDIEGARRAEIPVMHVLTGVTSARDIWLAPEHLRPDFLAIDLRDLNEPHLSVEESANSEFENLHSFTCGGSEVQLAHASNGLELHIREGEAEPITIPLGSEATEAVAVTLNLDSYRAGAAALWEAADRLAAGSDLTLPEINVVRAKSRRTA